MKLFRLIDDNYTNQKFNRSALLPVVLALACFALPQQAQATDLDGVVPGGNTADGFGVLTSLTTGGYNTGTGWFSLNTISSGSLNTAFGAATLFANTGDQNTAVGAAALFRNTTGTNNTANGAFALFSNTTGVQNTAVGYGALFSTNGPANNTAVGFDALSNNTIGNLNTANGASALNGNIDGAANTAGGAGALLSNSSGSENTANGVNALENNTTGDFNTAYGVTALQLNTTGNRNTAIGNDAGRNQTTGSDNVYIGSGMGGVAGENNACYIKSIFTQTSTNGISVFINSDNKLGTTTSSKRFKEDIKPMDKASKALLALKPVTFRYKKEIDPAGTSQFGLVAEEVEKVNPDLVVRDKEGKPYSVRYDQVNAMLLNEFLKEHRRVQTLQSTLEKDEADIKALNELKATVAKQERTISELTASLKDQASQIQKVSAQLEASKPAPQVVNNP